MSKIPEQTLEATDVSPKGPGPGYCPGGSWSGGICMPYNNSHRDRWMGFYRGGVNLPIEEMILPGTHHAGFDKEISDRNHQVCQDVPPIKQLKAGIRALDLRVQFFSGMSGPQRFQMYHEATSGRTLEVDVLDAVNRFHSGEGVDRSTEIVVLDFHQLHNFTDAAHDELQALIKRKFGNRIAPPWMAGFPVTHLWELKYNVVIAYNNGRRPPEYWPGVNQRFLSDTPSTTELGNFITRVGREIKPVGELRAIEAHKMTELWIPDDISEKVMEWFSDKRIPYEDKFYIINTDWSLRHRLVDNIIYANGHAAAGSRSDRAMHHESPSQNYNYPVTPYTIHSKAVTYTMSNGNWIPEVWLTQRVDTLLFIRSSATMTFNVHLDRTVLKIPTLPMHTGDKLELRSVVRNGKLIWEIPDRAYTPLLNGSTIPAPRDGLRAALYRLQNSDWYRNISLPAQAPNGSLITVHNQAQLSTTVSGALTIDGNAVALTQNRGCTYIYRSAQGKWELLSGPFTID